MNRNDPNGLSQDEREVVALLEQALARIRSDLPNRHDALEHIEEAIRYFRRQGEGIPPEQLNSANDG